MVRFAQSKYDVSGMLLDIMHGMADPTLGDVPPPVEHAWVQLEANISNFDHLVPEGLEDSLRHDLCYCEYMAMDFYAVVWLEEDKFVAFVMQYRKHVETIKADSLKEIMSRCSDKYGYE